MRDLAVIRAIISREGEIGRSKARCRRLVNFMIEAWSIVVPGAPFVSTWHGHEVGAHLEAVARRECLELVVSQPPGTTKSLMSCIAFPAWVWTFRAPERFLLACYAEWLGAEHNEKTIKILSSPWYVERWGHRLGSAPSKIALKNTQGGFVKTTFPGGGSTGVHADIKIIDDPIKPAEAREQTGSIREKNATIAEWYRTTFASRNANHKRATTVLVMQRLAEDDLAGEFIRRGFTYFRLPMRFEAWDPCRTPWGRDRRAVEGELLCPNLIDEIGIRKREEDLQGDAEAQLQQRPTPRQGGVFQRSDFKHYDKLPDRVSHWIQVWDTNFKGRAGSDPVVGLVLCTVRDRDSKPPRDVWYLVDAVEKKLDFAEHIEAIHEFKRRWPKIETVLLEESANGPAIAQVLGKTMRGIVLAPTAGGKISRANGIVKFFRDGRVFFPKTEWVGTLEEQLERFGKMNRDDYVDALSHGLIYLHRKGISLAGLAEAVGA